MFRGLALTALLVTSALASQQTTCQRATNNTEFNPHEPPGTDSSDGSWFEGWYLRVSADDGSGASFGVGIGHFPGQADHLSSPTAACFILVSSGPGSGPGAAGEQVRLYTRNFNSLHIASPAPAPAPPHLTTAGNLSAAAAAAGGRTEDAYGQHVGMELERAATAAAARRDARLRGDVEDGQVSFEVLTGSSSTSSGSSSDSSSGGGDGALWRQHARRRLHAAVAAAADDRQRGVIKPFASNQLASETADSGASGSDIGDADHSNGDAGGASTPSADDGRDFCAWRVTSEGVAVAAQLQGTRLQLASTPGACAAAEPWRGPGGCQSPEGWVSKIGFLLRLRYDVLTLRTPVSYSLSEAGDGGGSGGGSGGGGGAAEAKAGEEKQDGAAGDMAAVAAVAGQEAEAVAEVAPGGAQRADVGAAGQSAAGDGDGAWPGVPAGRLRGGRPLQLSGLGRVHVEKNWGQSFPDQWVWAQGHGSAAGRQTSFVMAGGLLPHVLSPALPTVRQYVLAYHPPPPAQPFAVDPWDPPLYSSLAVRGCDGVFSLELHTPLHVVHLVAAAEPHSFQALPCPTNAGFKNYSVESFTATVQLRVLERPFPFAPPSIARLLHEDTFAAAAMEFGGAYVCPEAMPQTAGVLSDELVRARAGRARGGGGGGRGKAASGEVEVEGKGGVEGEIVRQDWSPWRALWSSA